MKKLVVTLLTILTCGSAFALPLGNPSEASLYMQGVCMDSCGSCDPCDPCFSWCDAWSIRLGFYGDYVFERKLELDGNGHADVIKSEIYTNAGYIALNICDRVDLFTTLGTTSIHLTNDLNLWGNFPNNELSELDFSAEFSWSIGARATLWECGCWGLGIEGQYFQTNPDVDYILTYDTGVLRYPNGADGKYNEWQVGLGLSYRFATSCPTIAFVPYAGIKWSRAKLDISGSTDEGAITFHDLRTQQHFGYAIGTSFTLCDMVGVTVEGRFGDEQAVHVKGQFRF